MSRNIKQIQDSIINEKALHLELNTLNSPSQTSIWRVWTYITAVAIYLHETLWDKFKIELEAIVANAPIGTVEWVQQKSLDFQYDSINPQIVQLVNFVPAYNPIDATKLLITRASVKTLPNKIVSVKVAKSEPPVPLTSIELSSFKGYLDEISFAGVAYNAISLDSDKIYIDADIYYNGQYSTVISTSVIAAINTYLSKLPFDGIIRISALEDAIQGVAGVTDVVFNNVALRANATAFGSKTYLVQSNATIFNKYGLVSGYVIPETTALNTLTDTLTFITE